MISIHPLLRAGIRYIRRMLRSRISIHPLLRAGISISFPDTRAIISIHPLLRAGIGTNFYPPALASGNEARRETTRLQAISIHPLLRAGMRPIKIILLISHISIHPLLRAGMAEEVKDIFRVYFYPPALASGNTATEGMTLAQAFLSTRSCERE